jgi:hypothetical protein
MRRRSHMLYDAPFGSRVYYRVFDGFLLYFFGGTKGISPRLPALRVFTPHALNRNCEKPWKPGKAGFLGGRDS